MSERRSRVPGCHLKEEHYAKGLCEYCYSRNRHGSKSLVPIKRRKRHTALCHPDRKHYSKRLCKSCYWKQHEPKKVQDRRRSLRAHHGLTLEQYDAMLQAQGNRCAICNEPNQERNLCVDHHHATGKIRGLLCVRCNAGIGNLKEDPKRFHRALAYLELYSDSTIGPPSCAREDKASDLSLHLFDDSRVPPLITERVN